MTAKRPYGQGRTARAPEARMTPEALEALKAILDKDGVSYADWVEKKITEEKKMTLEQVLEQLGSEATEENFHSMFDGKSLKQVEKIINEMFPNEKGNKEFAQEVFDYAD